MNSTQEKETVDQAAADAAEDSGDANLNTPNSEAPTTESPAPDPSNPYYFPAYVLPTGIQFNGAPVPLCPVKDDPLKHIQKVHALPMRDDDIVVAAYPKCGSHWISEILHMLTTGQTEYAPAERSKAFTMLEFCADLTSLEKLTSPRILNSHLYSTQLPQEVVEKKVKIVHMLRNPKDTAVSMYFFLKQTACEQFTLDTFLKGYPYYIAFSHQFDYLRQMAAFEKAHPGHPIMHVHYEDLKEKPETIIKDLSVFLGVPASDEFCERIASACEFDRMKEMGKSRQSPANFQKWQIYRKGVVGDWKIHFSVAQNEKFDEFLTEQNRQGFGFTLE